MILLLIRINKCLNFVTFVENLLKLDIVITLPKRVKEKRSGVILAQPREMIVLEVELVFNVELLLKVQLTGSR